MLTRLASILCYFCSSTLLRPAPRSTLFPYTTLFRSRGGRRLTMAGAERIGIGMVGAGQIARDRHVPGDRKSTRLNSSHGYISYAVFCLKKKIHTLLKSSPTNIYNTQNLTPTYTIV